MMFYCNARPPLVLASASMARRQMLASAGVPLAWEDSGVDEGLLKQQLLAAGATPAHAARTLAHAKARAVAARQGDALVIGADQLLVCDGVWYDKPASLAEAEAQLLALSGRTQQLVTAAVVMQGDLLRWETVATPEITLRPFGADFVRRYLHACGDRVLGSVGACQIEHYGAQLIAAMQGDLFSILGLPLLPLLDFLRQEGVVAV